MYFGVFGNMLIGHDTKVEFEIINESLLGVQD
jgi:hypothetical protein